MYRIEEWAIKHLALNISMVNGCLKFDFRFNLKNSFDGMLIWHFKETVRISNEFNCNQMLQLGDYN